MALHQFFENVRDQRLNKKASANPR
jgi:hypothetical protein